MSLKVIDLIENRINKMRAGYIFTSSDFYTLAYRDIPSIDAVEDNIATLLSLVINTKLQR